MGPLTYVMLPDSLMRLLEHHQCGISSSLWCPSSWQEHSWNGSGTPIQKWVDALLVLLRGKKPLPPASFLAANLDVEASALRALDLFDDTRVAALFHADDPVFLH